MENDVTPPTVEVLYENPPLENPLTKVKILELNADRALTAAVGILREVRAFIAKESALKARIEALEAKIDTLEPK